MIGQTETRIIGFCGQTGAGKTSVVRELAHLLGGEVVSFGSYVRAEALRCGKEIDRLTLQTFGQNLIDEYGYERFVQQVLPSSRLEQNVLILLDGVRHVDIWQAVQGLLPQSMLIYLHCDEEQRIERLLTREHLSLSAVQSILQHPMDQNIVLLRSLANLLVLSTELERTVSEIIDVLRQKHFIN